jgi:small redox-active disulfide protein 2
MDQEITHIWVGGRKVGVIGLDRVFAEVRELGLADPVRVMAELLRRARRNNYVPVSAERDYCNALYQGYRRFLGEDVSEDHGMLEIRVLGPGCPRCEELMRRVKNAVAEMNLAADIEHVRDLKQIAAYGPAPTPVLVVGGKVTVSGRVPSVTELKDLLSP